jgi:hypothetical protein
VIMTEPSSEAPLVTRRLVQALVKRGPRRVQTTASEIALYHHLSVILRSLVLFPVTL